MTSYDDHKPPQLDHDQLRRVLGLQLAARAEWNQPPRLYVISRNTDGGFQLEAEHVVSGFLSAVQQVGQSLGEQLEATADALYRTVRHYPSLVLAESGFCGLALESEGWGLGPAMEAMPARNDDESDHAALQAASKKLQGELDVYGNRVSFHPDRIETALVSAATTDQYLHWGHWVRGAAAPEIEYAPANDGVIGGAVPEQLRRLVRIIRRHTGK
jgi:hypothetical protein